MFPEGYERMTYLEPFAGSLAVFFNKNRSVIETVNDLDKSVTNLFEVMRDNPDKLARLIENTPWARDEYKKSYEITGEALEDARRFLVRSWQAIGFKSSDITGWRNNVKGINGNITDWSLKLPERIKAASARLKHIKGHLVQIENQPAVKLIERHNSPNVFIYLDPPYVLSTRNNRIYRHEMSDADHRELLKLISQHTGPVLISGYDSEIYSECLKDWHTERHQARCEGGKKRTEVLWMNYTPVYSQMSLIS